MSSKKAAGKKKKSASTTCICGHNCHEKHAHLPGYLLMALGLLALPIQFDMIAGLEWARMWPILIVLFGFVFVVKTTLCRIQKIPE